MKDKKLIKKYKKLHKEAPSKSIADKIS